MPSSHTIVIVGGGAAGYFAAIQAAELYPSARVVLCEATVRPLTKVKISGGGRCNVTHAAFDPRELARHYPRGGQELLACFSKFQPRDTMNWFESRGVQLKIEKDSRVFPVSDSSESIIQCLTLAAKQAGVEVRLRTMIKSVERMGEGFRLTIGGSETLEASRLLLATGSAPQGLEFARALGHEIVPQMPSLFTFGIEDALLDDMAGQSFEQVALTLRAGDKTFKSAGPMLITHWGLSGPAVLRLSAFAARALYATNYKAELVVNFLPDHNPESAYAQFVSWKVHQKDKLLGSIKGLPFSKRFFHQCLKTLAFDTEQKMAEIPNHILRKLASFLTACPMQISSKGVFKEEFVASGGIQLKEVDFRNLQSRICPNLYFAGEILDIDGVTGGFNFQNAWTTAYIAASSMLAGAN